MKAIVLSAAARRAGQRPGLALSDDGRRWLLLDATGASAAPAGDLPSDAPLAVVLTDARSDRASGLLDLRDGRPIDLYATPAVFEKLTVDLPVLPILQHFCGVHWRVVAVAGDVRHAHFRIDAWPSLAFTAISIGGGDVTVGDAIALVVHDRCSDRTLFYAPALSRPASALLDWMDRSDCLVVGGRCRTMPDGSRPAWLDALLGARAARKVLLPPPGCGGLLEPGAVEIAYGGMEIEL